ncbi:MAG: HEAT repeat domain-containing protein [Waddliaceae bacterium]
MFRKDPLLVIVLGCLLVPLFAQISKDEIKKILLKLSPLSPGTAERESLKSRLFQEDEDELLSIFEGIISSKDLPRGFSYDSHVTLEAIKFIGEMKSERGWNLLIEFVTQWSSAPYSDDYWMGGKPREAFLLGQTCRVLAKSSLDVLDKIKRLVQTNVGDNTTKWLRIIIGFAGQGTYYNEIMKLLETDPDPYIREYAAFSLGKIGRKESIGLLEKALKDSFYVEETFETAAGDIVVLGMKHYVVREAAVHALIDLGVKIGRKREEIWIEE